MIKASLDQYKDIAGAEAIEQLYQLADSLSNITVVHVNSTALGGGVAEILMKMTPMTRALSIDTHWEVMEGSSDFFHCTKILHNAIQGERIVPSLEQLKLYEEVNKKNAEAMRGLLEDADVVIIHDPQPLPIIRFFPKRKGLWIWRCHIDASNPEKRVWSTLKKYIALYDASIFSLPQFAPPLPHPVFIIPPSIDPLHEKNCELTKSEINSVRHKFNIDPNRPLVVQVSRFDRFKDPLGVIQTFRYIKGFKQDLQLVLVGGAAEDDPEGQVVLKTVYEAAGGDRDIHILLLPNDSYKEINALQRAATIILQKSTKEGFGLTVTEGLWKGKPVIGGSVGGIKLQIINGKTGYLVSTPEGAAYRIRYLLQHPEEMHRLGRNGKQFVREKFLITRHLREYLSLVYALRYKELVRIELPGYYPKK